MKDAQQRWHPVLSGTEAKPMLWKLSGNGEVLTLGASLFLSLIALRILVDRFDWYFFPALLIVILFPLGTLVFLLKFICGKPSKHLVQTFEWMSLKRQGGSLIEIQKGGDE